DFLLSLLVVAGFNPASAEFQFVEQREWIRQFGIQYFIGLDGISLWLIPLTSLLTTLAIAFSWGSIETRVKEYYAFMLVLLTAMLGVFSAVDLFLFFVFWEASLIPMYFLIGMWGGHNRIY